MVKPQPLRTKLKLKLKPEAEAEAEAEEFFDFQLVRAKDLIRGIAIFQN